MKFVRVARPRHHLLNTAAAWLALALLLPAQALAEGAGNVAATTERKPAPTTAPTPSTQRDAREDKPRDRAGAYGQARGLVLFGANTVHEFLKNCPGYPCQITKPVGGALGAFVGYEWDGIALEGFGLLLMDFTSVSYTERVRVADPEAQTTADAEGETGGGIDIDIDIGPDGISIGGEANGEANGAAANEATTATVIEERERDALLMRYGGALGLGLRGLWFERPTRLTAAASVGLMRRGVIDVTHYWDAEARAYTAPFVMLDAGLQLGHTGSLYLGLFALVEFTGRVTLSDTAGRAEMAVSTAPQVYIGPQLGIQLGPKFDDN